MSKLSCDLRLSNKVGWIILSGWTTTFLWSPSALSLEIISDEYFPEKLKTRSVLISSKETAGVFCPSDGYVSDYLNVVKSQSKEAQLANVNDQMDAQWVDILDDVLLCSDRAIPILLDHLADDSPQVRYLAIYALGNLNGLEDSTVVISHRLARIVSNSSESDGNRAAAAYAIGQLGLADQATEFALVGVLKDSAVESVVLRENTVLALGQIRAQSQSRFLISLLEDVEEHASIRAGAASALSQLHVRDTFIAAMVLVLLEEETPDLVRSNVAYALRQLDINQPETLQTLVSAIRSKKEGVRAAALYSLGNLTTSHPLVLSSVNDLSKDADPNIRLNGVRLLGQLSDFQNDALLGLVNALDDNDFRVRGAAAIELGEAGHSESFIIRDLLDALDAEGNVSVRTALVYSLGVLGQDSEYISDISRRIMDILRRRNVSTVCSGLTECSNLKLISVDALGNLFAAENAGLKEQDWFMFQELLVLLEHMLDDVDSLSSETRAQVAMSLGKIASPSSINVLTETLSAPDADWLVKASAAEALGLIRLVPGETLKGLIVILMDDTENVRTRLSAATALMKIADPPISDIAISASDALTELKGIVANLKKQARQAEFLDEDRAGARQVIRAIRDFFSGRSN